MSIRVAPPPFPRRLRPPDPISLFSVARGAGYRGLVRAPNPTPGGSPMRTRLLLATVFAVLSAGLIAGPAHAASQQKFGQKYQMNGKTKSGRTAKGTFTVKRYVKSKYTGRLVAIGDWQGKVGRRDYTKRDVRAVAKLRRPASGAQAGPPPPPPRAARPPPQ